MKKLINSLFFILLLVTATAFAAEEVTFPNDEFGADMSQKDSIQRGAKYFVNYCQGCHSLKFQRYNRIGMDTGLDEKVIKDNLIFTGASIGQTMNSAIPADKATNWFGKMPPDLSLIARSKGENYVYNYLRAFYADPAKPTGFNNTVFPDVGMPYVLVNLEGVKKPKYEKKCHDDENGHKTCVEHIVGFTTPV
ncbi:MAG: cytochrome c1, partial [Ostreibacterium sp.]